MAPPLAGGRGGNKNAADAAIDQGAAIAYWNDVPATVNGMLGGYPQVSRIDLQGSANFLAKVKKQRGVREGDGCASSGGKEGDDLLDLAVDCGAGIGRITLGFLSRIARVVDVVEPVGKFTLELSEGESGAELRERGGLGEVFNGGLEEWTPAKKYDLIWNQWCVGHLKDVQLVEYLKRCSEGLAEGGWIVVKENMSTDVQGKDIFDELDSSITRTDKKFRALFEASGLKIVLTEVQKGFPKVLYPVRMYALQPASRG
ncbi:DUF858 domain protein [Lineolata rhizophorae]|uniref:Alpha N-terminal protein methyltransferase 1 n=1 Tax=Lineolata rhizophorae TaxID=578093 RepID=A0A6A6NRW1_9PEZI|nr:DUF858 domain protein [Lineolata rhizophorae]